MSKVKPLKKFGQNYLQDKNIIRKIANELSPDADDNVLEIGPGQGALTEVLSSCLTSLKAIEIDTRVIEDLESRFPNLRIYNKDFLKCDLLELSEGKKLKVIGNIPYNITSPIVFRLLESRNIVSEAVLMVQDEVAKRMVAKRGTKDYGILSILLDYFSTPRYCFKISPNVFYPRPKVNSAVVHFYFNKSLDSKPSDKIFIQTVKAAFGNRRKTLKNSLSNSIFSGINFDNIEIDLSKRAEELDTDSFKYLATFIQERLNL